MSALASRPLLLSFLLLCSVSSRTQAQAAPYRGVAAVEQLLTERLLREGGLFSFRELYLQSADPAANSYALVSLMGSYENSSGNNEFRNGVPNSINTLLWQLVLQLTANDVGRLCLGKGNLLVNPFFQATLDPLCRWPAPEAKNENSLRNFWLAVMGYDAPEEEFLAWQQFALTSSLADQPAAEAVPVLFFLITYNPHFLLRK